MPRGGLPARLGTRRGSLRLRGSLERAFVALVPHVLHGHHMNLVIQHADAQQPGGWGGASELERAVLQRQLQQVVDHAKQLSQQLDGEKRKSEQLTEGFRKMPRRYYKDLQNWRQRCSKLQLKLTHELPDDQDACVDDDVTFFNQSDHVEPWAQDIFNDKCKELVTRHEHGERLLHAKIEKFKERLDQSLKRNMALEAELHVAQATLKFETRKKAGVSCACPLGAR